MRFEETSLAGVVVLHPEPIEDDRGFFARSFCRDEMERHGLNPVVAQCSISFNHRRGTLRGMHYQAAPHEEAKLVRCTRGAMVDVALDLRPGSATHGRWVAVELTADRRAALYIPEGCAHGFQTLEDNTEVLYQISTPYSPGSARGVRWNDPAFGIEWPLPSEAVLSERDAAYPDYTGP